MTMPFLKSPMRTLLAYFFLFMLPFQVTVAAESYSNSSYTRRFVTYGETLFPVANELPRFVRTIYRNDPRLRAPAALSELQMGYICDHASFIWADIWLNDCKLAVFYVDEKGMADYDLVPGKFWDKITPEYPESLINRNIWQEYGLWLLGILFVMGIFQGKKRDYY